MMIEYYSLSLLLHITPYHFYLLVMQFFHFERSQYLIIFIAFDVFLQNLYNYTEDDDIFNLIMTKVAAQNYTNFVSLINPSFNFKETKYPQVILDNMVIYLFSFFIIF